MPPSTAARAAGSRPRSAGRTQTGRTPSSSASATSAPASPKFYKGASKARGSGIGLAVCEEIVTMHNGVLDIANAEGGGAVVTIRLPIAEQ